MADKSDEVVRTMNTRRSRQRIEIDDHLSDHSEETGRSRSKRNDSKSGDDYRPKRDHSKPVRFQVDLGYEQQRSPRPNSSKGDSPTKSATSSPQKITQKKTPAKQEPDKVIDKSPSVKKRHQRSTGKSVDGQEENGKDGDETVADPEPHVVQPRSVGRPPKRTSSVRAQKSTIQIEEEQAPIQPVVPSRPPQTAADFTPSLKENLRRLKNVLKLPKARRWVYCEFFYPDLDRQVFLGDNEFSQCLRESFPNLKCRNLTRIEWRQIRKLIGKPRRCSQSFFDEERAALSQKRIKIREIHTGSLMSMDIDLVDVPAKILRPLTIGAKVCARIRAPKDGIYMGTVDAVLPDAYRIIFDKEEILQPQIVKDTEVMSDIPGDLVAVGYFLEQNRASLPPPVAARSTGQPYLSPTKVMSHERSPLLRYDPVLTASSSAAAKPTAMTPRRSATAAMMGRDEKVGNFPVRLLVMLVKLSKLIEMKQSLVGQVSELNNQAERMNLLTDQYPYSFQEKYAQVIVDLETLNKTLSAYLNGINEYHGVLLPQLSEVTVTSRPDALRKLCHTHAVQIVKHSNNGLNVKSQRSLALVTSLTALLLQVRSLGQQSCNAFELNTLSEALSEIRCQVDAHNAAPFQDHVEVHMKQIHQMMLQASATSEAVVN